MPDQDDGYGAVRSTVVYNITHSNKRPIDVSRNSAIDLANYDTLAQLLVEKKKDQSSIMTTPDYVELFKSNSGKFVDPEPNDNNTAKEFQSNELVQSTSPVTSPQKDMKELSELEKKLLKLVSDLTNSQHEKQCIIEDQQRTIDSKQRTIEHQREIITELEHKLVGFWTYPMVKNPEIEQYTEQAKSALLQFSNGVLDILFNIPDSTFDDPTMQLLELLMKRSMCLAFEAQQPPYNSDILVVSSRKCLVSLMTKNGLNPTHLEVKDIFKDDQYPKLVKDLTHSLGSIPEVVRIDFSDDPTDKKIETYERATIENPEADPNRKYCISPSVYRGNRLIEQGVVVQSSCAVFSETVPRLSEVIQVQWVNK